MAAMPKPMLDATIDVLGRHAPYDRMDRASLEFLVERLALAYYAKGATVVAPAQGGYHLNGRETHGDSMIVDPWGVVLDRLPRGSGVVMAGINPEYVQRLRKSLPALAHRTLHRV